MKISVLIGSVENLNAVKGKYATKRTFFSHSSMLCKAALTAIDNNVNSNRLQVCQFETLCFLDFVFSIFMYRVAQPQEFCNLT